jgi:BirA family biotin operon repressor/biotin-[acetyl-CoA-carboxylase] ligase
VSLAASVPDALAHALEARRDELGPFGASVRWHARIGSTNDEAARWAAAGAPEGAVVVADEQTEGRGRRGRSWASPPGAGLYVSIVFRPASVPTPLLTLMAGVAVANGLRQSTGVLVTLKWPNDVVVEADVIGSDRTHLRPAGYGGQAGQPGGGDAAPRRWRKVAGILAEATTSGNALQFIVLGVGVNLRSADWPPEVAARATSLEAVSNQTIDRDTVLAAILAAMATGHRRLPDGERAALLEDWRRLSPSSRGRTVVRQTPNGPRAAVTAGIDEDGALLVEGPDGRERIVAGELVWE